MEQKRRIAIGWAGIATLLLGVVAWYAWQRIGPLSESPSEELLPEKELTKEEILQNLSAPADSVLKRSEEKKQILESLSAQAGRVLTNTEKEEVLKTLSAPSK